MSMGKISEFFKAAEIMVGNARSIPEISGALALYGYDASRLEQGARLLREATALMHARQMEDGERHGAWSQSAAARREAGLVYLRTLKIARIAFADDVNAAAALGLVGKRKQSTSGWIEQATTFYANLAADSSLETAMARFGYGREKLRSEAAIVEALRSMLQSQAREGGRARAATAARDAKLAELRVYLGELRAVARIAFAGMPGELRQLGIVAHHGSRKKKTGQASEGQSAAREGQPRAREGQPSARGGQPSARDG